MWIVMRVFPLEGITAPLLAFEKSYSGFISLNLFASCATRGNGPNVLAANGIYNHKDLACYS